MDFHVKLHAICVTIQNPITIYYVHSPVKSNGFKTKNLFRYYLYSPHVSEFL